MNSEDKLESKTLVPDLNCTPGEFELLQQLKNLQESVDHRRTPGEELLQQLKKLQELVDHLHERMDYLAGQVELISKSGIIQKFNRMEGKLKHTLGKAEDTANRLYHIPKLTYELSHKLDLLLDRRRNLNLRTWQETEFVPDWEPSAWEAMHEKEKAS